MEEVEQAARLIGELATIGAAVAALWRLIVYMNRIREGMKCQLRAEMLRIYYSNRENRTIRQYEKQNFCYLYTAYKALKGNSFIDDVRRDVDEWEMIS